MINIRFKELKKILIVSAMSVALASCGGSGDSSSKKDSSGLSDGSAGFAIKGAIDGGTVTCYDLNGNVVSTTTTNSDGAYRLDKKCPATGKLVVSGGTDTSSGEEIEEMIASGDSDYITPVTTMEKVMKDNGIDLISGTADFIKDAKTNNPVDNTSDGAGKKKKLAKTGLILHALVKNLQAQSDEDLSYSEAMKLVTEKLKTKPIEKFGSDSGTTSSGDKKDAADMIDSVLGTSGLANQMGSVIPAANITAIKEMVKEPSANLQAEDRKTKKNSKFGKAGNKFIPKTLRSGLKRGYVSVYSEIESGTPVNYVLKFKKNRRHKTKTGLTYECKVFTAKGDYLKANAWDSGETNCSYDTNITLAKSGNANKYLVVKYTKGTHSNYSAPHKIGSMVLDGNATTKMAFEANKVYLPIDTTWTSKTIADFDSGSGKNAANLVKIAGTYLPKGFYYKVTAAPTANFKSSVFGVKLTIGSKNIVMMADRLHIKKNAITAGAVTAAAANPYLHGIASTNTLTWRKSNYHYKNIDGFKIRKSLSALSRGDFNTKKGFLRFAPPLSGGTLKLTTDSALKTSSNYDNIVGVSLADMCAIEIGTGTHKATMCDVIQSTINAEKPAKVVITPFVRAAKRGDGMGGTNIFKTNQPITIDGKDFASFPAITILKPTGHTYSNNPAITGQGTGLKALDSDGDGTSDYWEMKLGRDPFVADPSSDMDSDGIKDKDEIAAGLDPRTSYAGITVTLGGSDISGSVGSKTMAINKGGSAKTFTVTLGNVPNGITAYVVVSTENNTAPNQVIAVSPSGASTYGTSAKTITVTPKSWSDTLTDPTAKVVVKVKLAKTGKAAGNAAELTKAAQIKKVAITSTDFADPLRPASIALTYQAAGALGTDITLTTEKFLVGTQITANAGTKASHTTHYKWYKSKNSNNCNRDTDSQWGAISGAEGTVAQNKHKYVLTNADVGKCIRAAAVFVASVGSADWTKKRNAVAKNASNEIVKVLQPKLSGTPTGSAITGTAKVGQTLTVSAQTATAPNSAAVHYKWERSNGANWTQIKTGASTVSNIRTHKLVDADQGKKIRVKVWFQKANYRNSNELITTETATIAARPAVKAPSSVTITGANKQVGTQITANVTAASGATASTTTHYQWQKRTNSGGSGATWVNLGNETTTATLNIPNNIGHSLRVRVRYKKADYTDSAWVDSAAYGPIVEAPRPKVGRYTAAGSDSKSINVQYWTLMSGSTRYRGINFIHNKTNTDSLGKTIGTTISYQYKNVGDTNWSREYTRSTSGSAYSCRVEVTGSTTGKTTQGSYMAGTSDSRYKCVGASSSSSYSLKTKLRLRWKFTDDTYSEWSDEFTLNDIRKPGTVAGATAGSGKDLIEETDVKWVKTSNNLELVLYVHKTRAGTGTGDIKLNSIRSTSTSTAYRGETTSNTKWYSGWKTSCKSSHANLLDASIRGQYECQGYWIKTDTRYLNYFKYRENGSSTWYGPYDTR